VSGLKVADFRVQLVAIVQSAMTLRACTYGMGKTVDDIEPKALAEVQQVQQASQPSHAHV